MSAPSDVDLFSAVLKFGHLAGVSITQRKLNGGSLYVPVRQCQNIFVVVVTRFFDRRPDNEWRSDALGILARTMTVDPVCPGLIKKDFVVESGTCLYCTVVKRQEM